MIKKTFVLILFLIILLFLLIPIDISNLHSNPNPAKTYDEAIKRIDRLTASESKNLLKECRLQFLTHNKKVEYAIVFVHGYTSCPEQFSRIGKDFYDLGYNVLIAPLPYHGLSDLMNAEHSKMKAENLVKYGDTVIDIVSGLGNKTVIAGISCGGVIASWAAQYRDINRSVIISPAFGFSKIPTNSIYLACKLFLWLPNKWINGTSNLAYVYKKFSTKALTQMVRLGFAVDSDAKNRKPKADSIIVITNANDKSIDNKLTFKLIKLWQDSGANLTTYEFEKKLKLEHDFIDPNKANQKLELVYPILTDLIAK